jgi:SAM-dependent methyltransferase
MAFFSSSPYQGHNHARLEHLASLGLPLSRCRVLELGSGPGDHTGFYVERDCEIVSVDSRQDCLDLLKERWPDVQTVLCDLNAPAPLRELGVFDVVHCYGILYHLEKPGNLLEFIGPACRGFAVVETCVRPGNDTSVEVVEETPGDYTQSSTGRGNRPSRRWVFEELGRQFPFVYHTRTQPNHPEFPIDWNNLVNRPPLIRSVFVGSRQPLELPSLSSVLLDTQERLDPKAYIAELESMLAAQLAILEEREQLIFRLHAEAANLLSQLKRAVAVINKQDVKTREPEAR